LIYYDIYSSLAGESNLVRLWNITPPGGSAA